MKYLTIVHRIPDDYDVHSLTSQETVSAMAWGHVIDDFHRTEDERDDARVEAARSAAEANQNAADLAACQRALEAAESALGACIQGQRAADDLRDERKRLRDHFAGVALNGMLSCNNAFCAWSDKTASAHSCYEWADAMLRARDAS